MDIQAIDIDEKKKKNWNEKVTSQWKNDMNIEEIYSETKGTEEKKKN